MGISSLRLPKRHLPRRVRPAGRAGAFFREANGGHIMDLSEFVAPAALFAVEVLLILAVMARCRVSGGSR
jgi:hypothetical protein